MKVVLKFVITLIAKQRNCMQVRKTNKMKIN